MAGEPVVDHVGLVGGVVVADEVDVQLVGDGLVDGDQELAELDRAVTAVEIGDDFAGGDVERGEQAGHPVAGVVVGATFGVPATMGSTGWDRSRACTWDFSSVHSTTAFSGGWW